MKCAWDYYINLLPPWMRCEVDNLGRENLQELRLRLDRQPELVCSGTSHYLQRKVSKDDLIFVVNAASRYSPWSSATSCYGYISAQGGHRVGICGEISVSGGKVSAVSTITSVSIRVARDFPGIGLKAAAVMDSILIVGRPGAGKTTLLRDIIRQQSNARDGAVCVLDERKEIFPVAADHYCFYPGIRTDILHGCGKRKGVEMLIRTMSPQLLAVDEITAQEDCEALLYAGWCGVDLIATAHAKDRDELFRRPVYRPLLECGLFQNLIVIQPDKSWVMERM